MKIYKICELGHTITGTTPSTKNKEYYKEPIYIFAGPSDISKSRYILNSEKYISELAYRDYQNRFINENDIAVSCIGYLGYVSIAKEKMLTNQQINSICNIKQDVALPLYLYYKLVTMQKYFKSIGGNGTALPIINKTLFDSVKLNIHELSEQQHIVNILGTIDDKIENNEKIISNLLNLANAKYLSFVAKNSFQIKKIDDVFDIAIGRTPPRKENEWFTIKPDGMKWISIADMGKCDGYIFNTSENLTYDAVKSFNIPIIPENTVILSFKLTVGRIAITSEKMLSNEAIAHFKTDNYKLVPYLYLFLKNYDFNKLGSTSSIATATNSKAVKSINFPLPDVKQIDEFYKVINPFFDKIKYLQYVNKKLQETKNLYLKKFFG